MATFGQFGIDAAVEWGQKVYFFSGPKYIRVSRTGDTGPGQVDPGYPRNIYPHWHFPNGFGANGIDAAMINPRRTDRYYFFSHGRFIEIQRTAGTGPGRVLTPIPLDDDGFLPAKGTDGGPINGGIRWGPDVSYFFRDDEFAQLHRDEQSGGPDFWGWGTRGKIAGHWNWPDGFGVNGISDAIRWGDGPYVYVFSGTQYIRIYTSSATGLSDPVDPGYPKSIYPHWHFPEL